MSIFIFSTMAACLIYLIYFIYLVSKRGLDPTLLTFSDLLSLNGFTGYRVCFAASAIFTFQPNNIGKGILVAVITTGVLHFIFLVLFQRAKTQPVYSYPVFVFAAAFLFHPSYATYLLAAVLVCLQGVYLIIWRRTQSERYNSWISQKAIQIDKSYGNLKKTMTPEEWFYVVHISTTESVARPALVRKLERLYWQFKKPAMISTGIMQVRTTSPLNDRQSMQLGTEEVVRILKSMPQNLKTDDKIKWLARHYNGSESYSRYLFSTYTGVCKAFPVFN